MILFNENSTEELDRVISELNRYFYQIDKDFFVDFDRLRDEIKEEYGELLHDTTPLISGKLADKCIPYNESIRIAAEVFGSVNPQYREMFLTLVRDPKYKFSRFEDFQTSINDNLVLSETIDDVLVIVHEFAHNFVANDDDCFFLGLFGEVNSIFWEKVAVDYLASQYDTYIDNDRMRLVELMKYRTKSLKQFYLDILASSKRGIDKEGFFDVYERTNLVARFFLDSELLFSRYGAQLFFLSDYYHSIGFLLANSMYQDFLDNPKSISKLYDVEKMNASSDDLIPECFRVLYEDDIPITHDGIVSLKGGNYEKLLTSLHQTMEKQRVKNIVE